MASKKLKKALGAALLGFGASKLMGAKADAIKKHKLIQVILVIKWTTTQT